jgi:hypothetical protein
MQQPYSMLYQRGMILNLAFCRSAHITCEKDAVF